MSREYPTKFELIARIATIKNYLKQGFTKYHAYKELKNKKLITCSRASFYRFVSKYINLKELEEAYISQVLNQEDDELKPKTNFVSKTTILKQQTGKEE